MSAHIPMSTYDALVEFLRGEALSGRLPKEVHSRLKDFRSEVLFDPKGIVAWYGVEKMAYGDEFSVICRKDCEKKWLTRGIARALYSFVFEDRDKIYYTPRTKNALTLGKKLGGRLVNENHALYVLRKCDISDKYGSLVHG